MPRFPAGRETPGFWDRIEKEMAAAGKDPGPKVHVSKTQRTPKVLLDKKK